MTALSGAGPRMRERGLALLVVLWAVAAAALLVSAFNVVARSGATFVASEVELTQAEALADAGLEIAAAHLVDEDKRRRWRADGRPRRLALGGAELTIVIDDPNGLIDVNMAGREALLGLLRRAMDKPEDAEAMLEKLMKLRGPASGAGGTAPEAQRSAPPKDDGDTAGAQPMTEPSQTAAKRRILDVTELRRMEGMTPALFGKIAPRLTVHSRDGRINPFHAPRAVLEALPGLDEIDIERFLASIPAEAGDDEPIPGSLGKAGALLANQTGPAFIVSVAVGGPGRAFLLGRQYVIAPGLDEAAPYRLLSTRPLPEGGFNTKDRAPQS